MTTPRNILRFLRKTKISGKIRLTIVLFAFTVIVSLPAFPQNSLYDDTKVASIHITIPPDSLRMLYDSILADHYYMAGFVFDDGMNKDSLENIGIRLRGNTSRYSQKKSFKISFNEYVPGREYQDVKKLNLNGEHNDPSVIREKLFYDLWKRAGRPERRTSFVRLYFNGEYYGIYTNLEEMDKRWLGRVFEKNGGNLFKCTYPADLVYHGENPETYKNLDNSTATGGRVYDLETNKSQDDYSRLAKLISTIHLGSLSAFEKEIVKIMDMDSYLLALALDVATGNWDDYSYNRNNFYLYDDPSDSLFRFITYDPDNTFGIDWYGIDWGIHDCLNWINPGMELPLARKTLQVASFYERYKQYLDTVARFIINPDSVFPRIDALKSLIRQAAEEDLYRTLDYGYSVNDFNRSYNFGIDDHTPYGLKPFLTTRKKSIIDQLNSTGMDDPGQSTAGLIVYPNPASDHINIRTEGLLHCKGTIVITDQMGIMRGKSDYLSGETGSASIDVRNLPPGIYFIQVLTGEKSFPGKFIKK